MKYGSHAYNALVELSKSVPNEARSPTPSALIAADTECKRLEEEVKTFKLGCEASLSALVMGRHVNKQEIIDYLEEILEVKK